MSNFIINNAIANDEWTLVNLPASQVEERNKQ